MEGSLTQVMSVLLLGRRESVESGSTRKLIDGDVVWNHVLALKGGHLLSLRALPAQTLVTRLRYPQPYVIFNFLAREIRFHTHLVSKSEYLLFPMFSSHLKAFFISF